MALPLEFNQTATLYNFQSQRGVPISTVATTNGSDGRLPTSNESANSINPATSNQFNGLISFGGGLGLTSNDWNSVRSSAVLGGSNAFSSTVADQMKLPVGRESGSLSAICIIQRQAQVGAPYMSRLAACLFGSVIDVPGTDESGLILPANVAPAFYWQAEPYTTNDHQNAGYYWSPNAGVVYATQPGPISITWIRTVPFSSSSAPAYTNLNGTASFYTNGANVYLLYTVRYIVSSSAVKTPRKMYWTEGAFQNTGKPVEINKTRVPGGVTIAYNSDFPETVDADYMVPGQSSSTNAITNPLNHLKTFYYSDMDGYLHAWNVEGRIFMELEGDARDDGSHESLGFEIVDVIKQPLPQDVTTCLGEQLMPPQGTPIDGLTPETVQQTVGRSFTYQHNIVGGDQVELFAVRETANVNDCLVFWMESGVQGLKWPSIFARYALVWPSDVSQYSHYIRPAVATEAEAMQTAVALKIDTVPTIAYQDPCDRPRAKLTTDFKFYTFLDATVPAHRTLLQFTSGGDVAFERVFSWLDSSLRTTNFTGSIATNLTSVNNYVGYPAACADYTNRLTAFSNYVAASGSYVAQYAQYTNYLAVSNQFAGDYANYTNYLVAAAAYAAQYSAYTNYVAQSNNYVTQVTAYTNYLAALPRGVNGPWKLYLQNYATPYTMTVGTWAVAVVTTNAGAGLTTNRFTGGTVLLTNLTANLATPYPSTNLVSGITNAVTAVFLELNGYTATNPSYNFVTLVAPTGQVCCAMGRCGGSVMGTNRANLVIDDAATNACPTLSNAGSYRFYPTAPSQASIPGNTGPIYTNLYKCLNAAPSNAVSNPGAAPAPVAYPGAAPTVYSNPGAAPTPVAKPVLPTAAADPGAPPVLAALWPDALTVPRVVSATVNVGDRLSGPADEPGQNAVWAGHVNTNSGTLYNPGAYVDPLVSGIDAGNLGAIIPVNAVPGRNLLEVWWFRADNLANNANVGHNAGNTQLGFGTVYWPSVLGRYTIAWPTVAREIVLASNLGTGTLDAFESLGHIYYQNATNLAGYNPNEEHAIMSAGIAYATRDDLNITNGTAYSSDPFVLVDYVAADGRPAMSVFHVLREKPAAGDVFDYLVPAGQLLQAPMPLPLLAKPVEGSGDGAFSHNAEPAHDGGDIPVGWNAVRDAIGIYSNYCKFTWQDRHQDIWVYRGPNAGLPALQAGRYDGCQNRFFALSNATAILGQPFSLTVQASRQSENLLLTLTNAPGYDGVPDWMSVAGLAITGTPVTVSAGTTNVLLLIVTDAYDQSCATNTLTLAMATSGVVVAQGPLLIVSTNSYTGTITVFSNRPPFLAGSAAPTNSFTMRYYYKTEASFAWPGLAVPPPAGSIVPYLRPVVNNAYVGDATNKTCAALDIVYRPYWPAAVPTLPYAYTLAQAAYGLPGVSDWKSAEILYQQSIAANISSASVSAVLFDPTREKLSDLQAQHLASLPSGVAATYFEGKYYFPNLPPHLATHLFMDPTRGANGSLVLQGEFKNEVMGDSYFLLDVLRDSDLAAAYALCPSNDTDYAKWTAAVNALAATLETFHEDPKKPGTYVADASQTVSVGVGDIVAANKANTMVNSYALSATGPGNGYVTLVENSGAARTLSGDPVALHIIKTGGSLYSGELKILPAPNPLSEQVTFQHTADLAGRFTEYEYEWKIAAPVDGQPPATNATMSAYLALASGTNLPRYILGGAGVQSLGDNYVTMRFRPNNPAHPLYSQMHLLNQWSDWTPPALCEGWIKRVLAGINPFTQRTSDLFNNAVNTDVSMLTQAGHRWEGDVALNADTLNDHGLIEIYETVLRRGRMLSIEAGYNYGPANDALLLVSGYLNDLYMMVGNEAWSDAANPTIGIGSKDQTYGDIATALFSFKGQEPSLLEEELALLRGRDDFLEPGVEVAPVYNRLVWNYTRGIDAGEVIYALNYNIQENPNQTSDGIINAADAAYMFPQGHGDAYGHYLTALTGYYSLLLNSCFDWVPRIESVNILGTPVAVDYQDERKFAAAAVAFCRAGQQVMDLTWRRDFQSVGSVGWAHLCASTPNTQTGRTEYWGLDHWATRTGQGAYLNWVVGNAILPDVDPMASHRGIQKVDRTTVPELAELASLAGAVQTDLDNAEGGLTPLGLPEGALAFDIDPNVVVGTDNGTHFEQIYSRAKVALNNAVAAFDDAKDVTSMMRAEQDSLTDFQTQVANQELAYNNALIELYGTPYPDDVGAGKTYSQGYTGPDLVHYAYVDLPDFQHPELVCSQTVFTVDIQQFPNTWSATSTTFDFVDSKHAVTFDIGPDGFLNKPATWTGVRASPGKIQQAVSSVIAAYGRLQQALSNSEGAKSALDTAVAQFQADVQSHNDTVSAQAGELAATQLLESIKTASDIWGMFLDNTKTEITGAANGAANALPQETIIGLATGGDLTSLARTALAESGYKVADVFDKEKITQSIVVELAQELTDTQTRWTDFGVIAPIAWQQELRGRVAALASALSTVQGTVVPITQCARDLSDAQNNYRAAVASGDRIQAERETFRRRSAVVVQGYRTRDAGFRIFRNEKLERYKTLFDLAARYAYLAANAYDYETGLLNTPAGQTFFNRIVSARALGVVKDGEPQYAGSDTGDPGLSSALAEMKADWDVLRGRLGFNNPDAYGTTCSLRMENLRIMPGTDGDANWKNILNGARMDNILDDSDVRRYCMQIDDGSGLAVPGIVLTFSTTIADGYNLFGQELAAGDHCFSSSSFATKIFAVGVALEGYRGMDNPPANSGAGGTSPSDPTTWYLDPLALAATPYIYLIPVGDDSMRSPPLGDTSTIRSWSVNDIAIPMPFNIGASDFSTKALWQSSDSLTEPLFSIRKHQAFRPVSTTSVFSPSLYGANGTLLRSQYMNNRLVGRSVWNTQWKMVIPGKTLLNDPKAGLDRFIQTVTDAKLYFVTYSYSGN